MPAGRPTDLTPEVIEDVKRLLPTVLYLETVADYIGVDRFTMRRWLKRGALENKRLRKRPRCKVRTSEAIFVEFCAVVKKALAEGLAFDLGIIKKASQDQPVYNEEGAVVGTKTGQWQAAAWRAERRFPEQWGRKDQLTHEGGKKPLKVEMTEVSDEQRLALFNKLHARLGASAGDPHSNGSSHPPGPVVD